MKFILIHGAYGNPKENWFPWLKLRLEEEGHEVIIPQFPTPEEQSLDSWMRVLNKYPIDKNTILIGHSLGCALILRRLEMSSRRIEAAFLVAGFVGDIGNEKFDSINKSFFDSELDWNLIKQNSNHFLVYASDNDPYVPLEKEKALAEHLGVELQIIKKAGHLNKKAGYDTFSKLLEDIKSLIG